MLPSIIRSKISRLRQWERSLRLVWGVARLVAVLLVVLVLACLTDYLVDRYQETPWLLRLGMLIGQSVIAAVLIGSLVVRPLILNLSDDKMALLVEEKYPELQHRLISVIQFHKPRAQTAGMSQELIGEVTKEAEVQTRELNFSTVADGRRLSWSLATVVPAMALLAGLFVFDSNTWSILLGRQALVDLEIPRLVEIDHSENAPYWAKGEKVKLRFRVTGKWSSEMTGAVVISPKDQRRKAFDLEFEGEKDGDGIFMAEIPGEYDDFEYHAHVADPASWFAAGRTREPGAIDFIARPVITTIGAWAIYPEAFGLKLPKKDRRQKYGRVVLIKGASADVVATTEGPIQKATLQLLGPSPVLGTPRPLMRLMGLAHSAGPVGTWALVPYMACRGYQARKNMIETPSLEEIVLGEQTMNVSTTNKNEGQAQVVFRPPITATGYRIKVLRIIDEKYKFENIPMPRRSISFVEEEPPTVALLTPEFPPELRTQGLPPSVYRVVGLPVPEGKGQDIRISYSFKAPFGVQSAILFYRVLRPTSNPESGSEQFIESEWYPYKLEAYPHGTELRGLAKQFQDKKLTSRMWTELKEKIKPTAPNLSKIEQWDFKEWKAFGAKLRRESSKEYDPIRLEVFELRPLADKAYPGLEPRELELLSLKLRQLRLLADKQFVDTKLVFDHTRGTFFALGDKKIDVPFYRDPTDGSEGRFGGGRIHLKTENIPVGSQFVEIDANGKRGSISLQKGDQLEYYVKVFAGKAVLENGEYVSEYGRPWAQSEPQVTRVVSRLEQVEWALRILEEGQRVRNLKRQQQGVFGNLD
ncbi:MAG: hypothetical protein ACFCD0_05580 [Gemmataceae bacterium]